MDTIKKIFTGWYFMGIINLYELIVVAILSAVATKASMLMPQVTDLTIMQVSTVLDVIVMTTFAIVIYQWRPR